MTAARPRWIVLALAVVATASIACGDEADTLSPTVVSGTSGGHQIEGTITAVIAGARSIQVASLTVGVPDTASIRRGGRTLTFADLRVGQEIEVHAVFDGTTFRATDVEVRDTDEDDEDLMTLTGTVSNLAGTCPSLTFVVRERIVRTGAATVFDGGCSRVRNGVRVEARGALAADGSLIAARVELDD